MQLQNLDAAAGNPLELRDRLPAVVGMHGRDRQHAGMAGRHCQQLVVVRTRGCNLPRGCLVAAAKPHRAESRDRDFVGFELLLVLTNRGFAIVQMNVQVEDFLGSRDGRGGRQQRNDEQEGFHVVSV
jgi:hypothetical protein